MLQSLDVFRSHSPHDNALDRGRFRSSAYNTTENAADIADLRTALKIDQWNGYGVSRQ